MVVQAHLCTIVTHDDCIYMIGDQQLVIVMEIWLSCFLYTLSGLNPAMLPANNRRWWRVTLSVIGWTKICNNVSHWLDANLKSALRYENDIDGLWSPRYSLSREKANITSRTTRIIVVLLGFIMPIISCFFNHSPPKYYTFFLVCCGRQLLFTLGTYEILIINKRWIRVLHTS